MLPCISYAAFGSEDENMYTKKYIIKSLLMEKSTKRSDGVQVSSAKRYAVE